MKTVPFLTTVLLLCGSLFAAAQGTSQLADRHEFQGPILDIAVTADGTILVTNGVTVQEIRPDGVHDVVALPMPERTLVNGLFATNPQGFLAASGGGDLAEGAGVWRVSNGDFELYGDVEAFETAEDPDALEGTRWKDAACEEDPAQNYSAGPQSNPYHLAADEESTAIVADAAGNTLLSVSSEGVVDWIAVFTPPTDDTGDWRVLKTAEDDPSIECYVQPVPTAVAIGPDGALYVGELTGAPAVPGWSRVWRIEPGASHVSCPSEECTLALSGLTSVIDVAFGPDGRLYVVELDAAGWLAPIAGTPSGGTIKRCDVAAGTCEVVEQASGQLGAIAFDASGVAWTVENESIFGPGPAVVRRIEIP